MSFEQRRWISRIGSLPIIGLLLWTGWFGWNWPVVAGSGLGFALLTTFKNDSWTLADWRRIVAEHGRPEWGLWAAIALLPFSFLFALAFHALAYLLSSLA